MLKSCNVQAKLHGEFFPFPEDLYIPPDALEIFLETFEGPLDLLLYLIKKQNINILDIPIAPITEQYLQYVEIIHSSQNQKESDYCEKTRKSLQDTRFELIAEYLLMAAVLMEIKSRMLLPRHEVVDAEEEDPRAELVRRLQEYEQFKKAAAELDKFPQEGKDVFTVQVEFPKNIQTRAISPIPLQDLLLALKAVLARSALYSSHKIATEQLSVRERMSAILSRVQTKKSVKFTTLFECGESRLSVVVSFLAVLELLKQALIEVVQECIWGEFEIRLVLL